jgi:Predicted molecular chaperone distantly related to HSP70-fold metalloproteases
MCHILLAEDGETMADRRDEVGFRASYAARTEHLVVGIMSGTSLDGVDATLVRILTAQDASVSSVSLLSHYYLPYSDEFRAKVAALCSPSSARIDDLTYVHFGLSEWYARAVLLCIEQSGINASEVDALSMHGQTVWHAPIARPFPGPEGTIPVKGTLQLGSGAVLRERTGIPVISDLRSRDMAAGGEGAPLAPYIDAILFGSKDEGRIVQNIGGIGNATVVPALRDGAAGATAALGEIVAFDTGPGNMVIDGLVAAGTEGRLRYDPEGSIAAKGRVEPELLAELMKDPFFSRRPPKSTGREVYGSAFVSAFMERARSRGLSFEDEVATATAFTAESIVVAYRDFIFPRCPIGRVLVAGGGALNLSLLSMLRERLPAGVSIGTTTSYGVPDQAREAMAFALLGHESLMGRPSNLPAVTGARSPVVLGCITL